MIKNLKGAAIALVAMIATPALLMANGDITGKIIEKDSGEPIAYATVQLIDGKTGKPLTIGTNTDDNGNFVLSNVPDGSYIVKVSNLGNIDQERPVKISGENASIGTVRLADDTKLLQEVVVEGVRSQMRFELDRKVFNVDANIAAAGASASELLESIPSVEVDQDGEVSLRGNSSVSVWINGKESGLTADNRAQILEQIPAETIEKIEVITNPSAKYSPEGTAGIINIVLKKDRRAGYFGGAEIGANTRGGANVSANINVNAGKWDTYASLGLRMRHSSGGSESDRLYDDGSFLNTTGDSRNHGDNIFARLGATYHLTDKDDFYMNAFGMFGHRWGHTLTAYESNLPDHWLKNSNLNQNKGDNRGVHAELGYTHKWSDTHTLDINGGYNYWGGPSWNSYLQHQEWEDQVVDDVYQYQSQNIKVTNIEAKIDYVNQLTSWLKLEAGFNGNYNLENTPVETYSGTSDADKEINPLLWNTFKYNNYIDALYATLGGKYRSFSFSAGLRAESWQVNTRSLGYGQTDADVQMYKKSFFSLFPSAFLSWSLPHDNELQINYTRRIRRPWGGQLNSFANISDPTNISYGNPELQPEYSNSFELNYIKTFTNHIISVSAYLRHSTDMMNRISYLDNNVLYSTFVNVGSQMNSGVELVVKNSLFKRVLDLTTTVNLYNNHQSAWQYEFVNEGKKYPVSGVARNSFAWDGRIMAQVRLPWGISLQASGNYRSKMMTAQGSHDAGWSVDAGLRKTVGNWSFSINCRDIFDSRRFSSTTIGEGYTQTSKLWRAGRTVRFTVKYSFGNMRAKKNRNAESEPMDGSGYGEMEM